MAANAMGSLRFHLTLKSDNIKTGSIPVSTSSRITCPLSCPLRWAGCYAENFPLRFHWDAVTRGERGTDWPTFLAAISALPVGQLWRHNVAGDLYRPGNAIGQTALRQLTEASRGRRGFTYSHHLLTRSTVAAFKVATAAGFTVNVSTETETAADAAVAHGLRAVTVVPSTETRRFWRSPDGNSVVVCPVQIRDGMTCERCRLCHARPQEVIVAFLAHGTRRGVVDRALVEVA
jgi:hypothetical protein